MNNDYDIRQLVRMHDAISSSEIDPHKIEWLFELSSTLEALISSLQHIDLIWIEKLREQWLQLELTSALLQDENRSKLTQEDLSMIEKSLRQMKVLIKSQLSLEGKENEQLPPWEKYPGYPPYDCFWRQPGEAWMSYVWLPYWNTLSSNDQAEYLKRWNAPEDWISSIEFSKMLEEIDS